MTKNQNDDNNSSSNETKSLVPSSITQAVLVQSIPMPESSKTVVGPDFNKNLSMSELVGSHYFRIGFQATNLGKAIEIINNMVINCFWNYYCFQNFR